MSGEVAGLVVEQEDGEALVLHFGLAVEREDEREVDRSVSEGRVLEVAVSEVSVRATEWGQCDLV